MQEAWNNAMVQSKASIARNIKQVGQLMAATELRSTNRYWHIKRKNQAKEIYPKEYRENVVGILWQTMAQFGTWL